MRRNLKGSFALLMGFGCYICVQIKGPYDAINDTVTRDS